MFSSHGTACVVGRRRSRSANGRETTQRSRLRTQLQITTDAAWTQRSATQTSTFSEFRFQKRSFCIKGRFSRSRTLSATTRRRRRGAVCRVRGGAGRLALARWTMGTVLLLFSFFEAKADDDKCFILCWEQASLWDSKSPNMSKMGFEENVVFSVEVGMHSDRARDYQTLHSDYFLRLNSI